jgi:hypothetical protein
MQLLEYYLNIMDKRVANITEFKSHNSTYSRVAKTNILNGKEDLQWKKECHNESYILDRIRYLSPQDWSCLIGQLMPIIEYNSSVENPEEWVSIEGGLVTVFDVFPKDYRNTNGIFLPGGIFFYRQKIDNEKFVYGYSGLVVRVGNPNNPNSYIELKRKDYNVTNTVSLGVFKQKNDTPAGDSKSDLLKAYAQMGIK